MLLPDMSVDSGSCLRSTIAFGVIELKCVNGEFAYRAFEREAAIQGLGGVVTHSSL